MSASVVFLIYAGAAALALLLLWFFQAHWYWHVLSVVVALVIGLLPAEMIPPPAEWGVARDMVVGGVFIFLMIWGLGAPLFHQHHHKPHAPGAGA